MHLPCKLDELFESLAIRQPSAPAVITDESVTTYAMLDSAAYMIAGELHRLGIGNQEAIGVLVERSKDLPAAFLGILKAGGVYVPMVADLPAGRLADFAAQADIRRMIVLDGIEPPEGLIDTLIRNGGSDERNVVIRPENLPADRKGKEPLPERNGSMTDLAAILFTSGSTGTPKGVTIRHDACANMVLGHIAAHRIRPEDRILLATSPGFILGFRELCMPLAAGSAFVSVNRTIIDQPDRLLEIMERHRVSIALFTPSYLRLLNGAVPRGLRCIITAGERPNAADARHYARQIDYWAVYGATETCGTICMYHVSPDGNGPIPAGGQFANTTVRLLDESGSEVQEGEVGEIHAFGVCVSPGYIKQPGLTAQSFVETRYGRAFRTRDLARRNPNGEIETLGRADDVVKISGQKVPLGEIERTLMSHPCVRRAAALQMKGMLVACVECPDPDQARGVDWREFLGRTLPSYMIPAKVVPLHAMPISSAGKIDRGVLQKTALSALDGEREQKAGTPPQGSLERAVAGIWEELLDVRPIFREDNFFAVGGTSLLAIAVSQRLQALGYKATVQMALASLTVESLAARINASQKETEVSEEASPVEGGATSDQGDFQIAAELGLSPDASHIIRVMRVKGRAPLPDEWQSAWMRLIDRHAALRTSFSEEGEGNFRWHTAESGDLPPRARLSFDRCASIAAARDSVTRSARARFRMTEPPLYRGGIITVDEGGETLFWLVLHHSVVDGTSVRIILEDFLALLGGRSLPPAPHGIAIAGNAERLFLVSDRASRDREFWRTALDNLVSRGDEPFSEYMNERPRPPFPSGRAAPPLIERLHPDTVEQLGRIARSNGAGLHALLLALLAAETRRRVGIGDVIIGNGISLRPAGGENAVGHFVNVLPVILVREDHAPFSVLLRSAQSALTETVEHAAYPASMIYREFRQRHPDLRERSRTSLFDIALTAVPPRACVDRESGLTLEPRPLPGEMEHPSAGLDLSFSHEPCPDEGGGLNLHLVWNQDVCAESAAVSWLSSLASWARWLVEEPDRIERPLPALLPGEEALLEDWEHGPARPRPDRRCHEIFEEHADRYPERPAVVGNVRIETFAELDARANGIAHRLISQGVRRGTAVAVLAAGTAELPAAALGVWKAGGVYLPLEHELPAARLAGMATDADAKAMLVLDGIEAPDLLTSAVGEAIRIEECAPSSKRPRSEGSTGDIAYIIYTSGTTGTPKGVPVTHAGYLNAVLGIQETAGFRPDDRMSLVATVGFDASLWELGHWMIGGIALVPISRALREDPWQLKRHYREKGVTIAFHTPSYLRISEQEPFEGLRILFTGGEAPGHRDVLHHASRSEFWNCCGPTETTILVLMARIAGDHDPDTPLPVGKPLPNVRISIRHKDGTPAPPGALGEIWIGGVCVARDYMNRPELSTGSFLIRPEGRYYRSGDYGRWTPDGQVLISGRMDDQIKLNGQRVELGEIRQTLCDHPAVADAAVLVDVSADGVKALRAFIRPRAAAPSDAEIAEFLAERLPVHMHPASITPVAEIPLTLSGKVDRKALLELARRGSDPAGREMPRGETAIRVAAIWSAALGVPVARNDNFFALGGNSLLAVTVAHRVSESLGMQVSARQLFAAPRFAAFVAGIDSRKSSTAPPVEVSDTGLVTEGEREFWTAEQAGLDTRTFIIPIHYLVVGEVTPDQWYRAWSTLVDRHEGLRTFYEEDNAGELRRRIVPSLEVALEFSAAPDRAAAVSHIRQRQAKPLSMRSAPLWRAGIVDAREDGARFFWLAMHHAIGDGHSVGTLFDEMTTLLADGELPPPEGGGRIFAARERAYLVSRDSVDDAEYWANLMNAAPAETFAEWPLETPRSTKSAPGNHRLVTLVEPGIAEGLKTLARRHESSLHSLMIALLSMETARRTGRSDMLIGTTASAREMKSDMRIVGYSVNMLPLHSKPALHRTFGDLLRATQHSLAEALQHVRLPFSRIYHAFWNSQPGLRNPQRYPLFDIGVTENPAPRRESGAPRFTRENLATESVFYERTEVSPGMDIVMIHEDLGSRGLILQLQFNAALYGEETARNWFDSLAGWARWFGEEPDRAVRPLPQLLPEETEKLDRWAHGETVERPELRFHELFEMVARRPGQSGRPAVVTRDRVVSYRSLDKEAERIARALQDRGADRGSVVAVLTSRSPLLPAAVLGVWKAGAIYLPLLSTLPPERLSFMARDAGASQLVVLDGIAVPERLSDLLPAPIRPEELPAGPGRERGKRKKTGSSPTDTAYIIYTSGTTGEPKGTIISHGSYVNLALGAVEICGITPDDRCLMFALPSFDVSLSDIGGALAAGAAICPAPEEAIESPNRFLDLLRDLGVTVVDITPTYLRLFEGAPLPPAVRVLITGGEPPSPVDAEIYAGMARYFNAYGPTENTITSTMGLIEESGRNFQSAGRPLPNTSARICSPDGNPLPPGVIGEICLGGAGVSRGYLNRPELTSKSFPETPDGRGYRTGDLGRWRRDSTIEIIGRMDDQVKLSGIRIELGEIEHALAAHPSISQAVGLLARANDRSKSLWAAVRLSPGCEMPVKADWYSHLAARLPSHMIPSGVIAVPAIPLTAAGKVDRAALLSLVSDAPSTSALTAPQGELEQKIAEVWSAVLGRSPIHREDNFFALGGHSLLAIAVAHRLEKSLGREAPARELFAEPTLAGFAERIRGACAPSPVAESVSDLATVGQREFWTAEQAGLDTRGFNVAVMLDVRGYAPETGEWRKAWNKIVSRHEALRTGFSEDDSGTLRRIIASHHGRKLEAIAFPSMDEARAHIRNRQSEPFSMGAPCLWRAGLTRTGKSRETIFWLVMHHAVCDGISLGVLTEELNALLADKPLSSPVISYSHVSASEAQYLESDAARSDAEFWRRSLGDLVERVPDAFDEWPIDKPRPGGRTAAMQRGCHCFRTRIDKTVADRLHSLARRNGATLHALMLALLGQEARRRTGRAEFLLGTAASTRLSAAEATVVGYFVNMIPLRLRAAEDERIDTIVKAMQRELAQALQHSRYPFAMIYGDFRRDHRQAAHPARYPLFDIAATENPASGSGSENNLVLAGVTVPRSGETLYELRPDGPAQDMVLVHEGGPDGSLMLAWFVNAAVYTDVTARLWFDSLTGWMRFLADLSTGRESALPRLLPDERRLLDKWQQGPSSSSESGSFPELFQKIAQVHRDRPALVTGAGVQSFGEVNARADALASALAEFSPKRGEPIAVLAERSTSLPETALAIWKAGCCYMPLTADLPVERLAFMAKDAGIRLLIALDGLPLPPDLCADRFTIIRPEELPLIATDAGTDEFVPDAREIVPEDPAYILYTSGSTGAPKGVVLRHGGMLNLGLEGADILGIKPEDRTMTISSPSFDLWISDLTMTWSAGAALVPVRREEMNDISGMRDLIKRHSVTVATMSPSYLRLFERVDLSPIRILMTVGEPPLPDDARHYAGRLAYFNGYGPTENTAGSAYGRVSADAGQITAGRPLANTSIYIVDPDGKEVPPGVVGEIWVGGIGLAAGYLNRPDLTAAVFTGKGKDRRYRTGDLGRWLPSGELLVLGRLDSQVKLRGQRVELGEIEHRIASYPGVRQAVAAVETMPDSTQILRAFIIMAPGTAAPAQAELASYLSVSLPSYMVPSTIVAVAAIPLTSAGKVDSRALFAAMSDEERTVPLSGTDGKTRTHPRSAVEKRIAEVWSEQLGASLICREDDFFESGGDSLRAIAVIGRLRCEFECRVNDLYEHPVLADFAGVCRPRPDHLRNVIQSLRAEWGERGRGRNSEVNGEGLLAARNLYKQRSRSASDVDIHVRRNYRHALLTGASGYLGSYLLRELLADGKGRVTAIVRGGDNRSAKERLQETMHHYFGADEGSLIIGNVRLTVLAGDLRDPKLLLSPQRYGTLVKSVDSIYHCAANTNHIGHYRDFHADNVDATRHLISLAGSAKPETADFHFVSTLSVAGDASAEGIRLFTEFDFAPEEPDDNYYIRTKQAAEQLVTEARGRLANASIYRIGNVAFAADSGRLQRNIEANAFFRHIAAFIRLGAVPTELYASLSHVDVVARAIVALAGTEALKNETHHIETDRRDSLADFIRTAEGMPERIRACDFGAFLDRLRDAVDESGMESAVAETVETLGADSGSSRLTRFRRREVVSDRTKNLLDRIGIAWPEIPRAGQSALLLAAMKTMRP